MNKHGRRQLLTIAVIITLHAEISMAANIGVTNVTIASGAPAGQTYVQCDISWDASWRASWVESGSWINWDAAWVFVKYRVEGATSWSHATLSTNESDHTVPVGAELDVGVTGTNGMGVFIYRSAEGFGSWTNTGVKLRWLYEADGVANTSQVDVCVHVIEMVYVPEGTYDLGDGNGSTESSGAFHVTDNTKVGAIGTTLIQNIKVDSTSNDDTQLEGSGIGIDGDGGLDTDNNGSIDNANFPTGYKAFYCMKYEISQGQYADFLNQLSSGDATTRYPNYSIDRYTIGGSWPNYTSVVDRACNYLSWADVAAYADWSGLRPMTELEYEKACRGSLAAVFGEYAWGNNTLVTTTSLNDDGTGTETANPANANCNHSGCSPDGPFRCGIYADASSDRTLSGSTYWGIMEMTGNVYERVVTVGSATGRGFTGLHGDGELGGGSANVAYWPNDVAGAAFRGGSSLENNGLELSYRSKAVSNLRSKGWGGRGVRSDP